MFGSLRASPKGPKRERKEKGEGFHNENQARSIISACLSWLSSWFSSMPWWGLTPPGGRPRLTWIVCASHGLNVRPVIRETATSPARRSVKAVDSICGAGDAGEGLHLDRHGRNLRHRRRARDGPGERRRRVSGEPPLDDAGS